MNDAIKADRSALGEPPENGKKTEARWGLRLHTSRIVESYLPEQVQTALPHLAHVVAAGPQQEARARAPTEARVSSSFVIVVGQWPLV